MVYWDHQCPANFSDHTYKTAEGGVKLDLRVFPAETASPAPWVLYIHGGAFAAGKHYLPNAWVVPGFRSRGIHVVSVAYRFAPQVGVEEMLQDVLDASDWCRSHLPAIFGAKAVAVDRYVVAGESAGAYLAALAAFHLRPSPRAVIDIYGPVDIADPAHRTGSNNQPLTDEWSEEEVAAEIAAHDASRAITVCPFQFDIPIEAVRKQWGAPWYNYDERQRFQYEQKKLMRTRGNLWDVILRKDLCETDNEFAQKARRLAPYSLLDTVTAYPPTYFLHGEEDWVVPPLHALGMAEKLKSMGIDVGHSIEPGEGHEFDNKYTGPDVEGWSKYIEPILDFAVKYTSS